MANEQAISFQLNGKHVSTRVASHLNLVELLNQFSLCGARESCGQGLCGCCSVLVDDQAVSACLTIASTVDGKSIETVEGLSSANEPVHPIQQAFIDSGAFQCGFCTPGFIMMTKALLAENPDPSDEDIRHYFSGNLCRCGTYPEIMSAVKQAARLLRTHA